MLIPQFQASYGNQCFLSDETKTELDVGNSISESHTETTQVNGQETSINEALRDRLKEIFNSPMAHRLIQSQRRMQNENQEPNTMCLAESTDPQHASVYITPGSFRIVDRKLGEGAQGCVYEAVRLFNDSDKQDVKEALKFSNNQHPHRSSLLSEISVEERGNLNFALQSYTVTLDPVNPDPLKPDSLKPKKSFKHCDVLPLGKGDFKKVNLLQVEKPIQYLLNLIKDAAKGADVLHKKNILHRDIKPDNIIITEDGKNAELGDLDLICKMQARDHFTSCTPMYAHPCIWGNDLMKQTNRRGIQTKEDDVLSLGKTVQHGLISRIFALYEKTKRLVPSTYGEIFRDLISEEKVNELVKRSNLSNENLIVLSTQEIQDRENPNQTKTIPRNILLYPSIDTLSKINRSGLIALQDTLTRDEHLALHFAVNLANNLQSDNPVERCSMQKIVKEIEKLQNYLKTKDLNPSTSIPVQAVSASQQTDKRQLEATSESSQQKKRVKKEEKEKL